MDANLERFAEFMARMVEKYADELEAELSVESNEQEIEEVQ